MKKIIKCATVIVFLTSNLFAQNNEDIMKKAFETFSKSPFSELYATGGAFYSGDDMDQIPMLVSYYRTPSSKNMKVLDGLLGSLLYDAKVEGNTLYLDVPQWETNFTTPFSQFALEAPIMRYPKVYSDIIEYKFIDLNKPIISSNLTTGKNWHTLKIGYKDRVDTIVFSSTTSRVRTFTTAAKDNVIAVELGSYTTVNNIPYPKSFTLTSKKDNREIRLNITNVTINEKARSDARNIGW